MTNRLDQVVVRWAASLKIDPSRLPTPESLRDWPDPDDGDGPCRPGVEPPRLRVWERNHGFRLPRALRAWLKLSDGLYGDGPLVHPLHAIGPMIPFATLPEMIVQPESWFEIGNPATEPVCIDLAYRWPDGDFPIFTSGDDQTGSAPRLIADSFENWLLRLLESGGREYWFDPDFESLGDPWAEHRRRAPAPPLPARLRGLAPRILPLMRRGADERSIADRLGISLPDVEVLFRHLQHVRTNVKGSSTV